MAAAFPAVDCRLRSLICERSGTMLHRGRRCRLPRVWRTRDRAGFERPGLGRAGRRPRWRGPTSVAFKSTVVSIRRQSPALSRCWHRMRTVNDSNELSLAGRCDRLSADESPTEVSSGRKTPKAVSRVRGHAAGGRSRPSRGRPPQTACRLGPVRTTVPRPGGPDQRRLISQRFNPIRRNRPRGQRSGVAHPGIEAVTRPGRVVRRRGLGGFARAGAGARCPQ